MKIRTLVMVTVLSGLFPMAKGEHAVRVMTTELNQNSYVKVREIQVNGVTADSVEDVAVADGSDVAVIFENGSGYIWGEDTFVYSNVTTDITISSLPKPLVSYMGTSGNPILIRSFDDLLQLRQMSKSGHVFKNVWFRQTVDLDLSQGGPWTPIGERTVFMGVYDGGGHRMDNVTLANSMRTGIFCYVSDATIKNLTVRFLGFERPARGNCGGAIVANATSNVRIVHVIAEGELSGVDNPSAGIAVVANRGDIVGCTNRLSITGTASEMGGLVAQCGYSSSVGYKGVNLSECANEGRLENFSTRGGTAGMVGKVQNNQKATFWGCVCRGEIVATNKASLIGEYVPSAQTEVTVSKCSAEATLPPIAVIGEGQRKLSGLYFATVSSGIATFCQTPTVAGVFSVMLDNAEPIQLRGVTVGDRLVLEGYEKYSGVVTCADDALSVNGLNGVWTVVKSMSVDAGEIVESSEAGVFELHPIANQTSAIIEGFSATRLKIPGSIQFIRGVDCSRLSVANEGHDVTTAVAFSGDEENGYALTLDGSAVVNGVKVTPTIGEGISDAFTVANGTCIKIRSVPGLWYGLYRGRTPESIDELCMIELAGADTITLSDELTSVPNAFYRVKVFLASPLKD